MICPNCGCDDTEHEDDADWSVGIGEPSLIWWRCWSCDCTWDVRRWNGEDYAEVAA